MNINDAKLVIRSNTATTTELLDAVQTVATSNEPFSVLVECMKTRRGIVAEHAMMALYSITARPRDLRADAPLATDWCDWDNYLRDRGLIR